MKLLRCSLCEDVFQLRMKILRSCECGRTKGKYINNLYAFVSGKFAQSIAIGNGSLQDVIYSVNDAENKEMDRNWFIENYKIDYCWVRPNEGKGNPHTFYCDTCPTPQAFGKEISECQQACRKVS